MKKLKDYIFESKIVHEIKSNTFYCDGGTLNYFDFTLYTGYGYDDAIEINILTVSEDKRGQQIGTKLISRIKDYATQLNRPLILCCSPLKITDNFSKEVKSLENFYKKQGFKTIQNINGQPLMIWVP